jgi:hypothetical protein
MVVVLRFSTSTSLEGSSFAIFVEGCARLLQKGMCECVCGEEGKKDKIESSEPSLVFLKESLATRLEPKKHSKHKHHFPALLPHNKL